MSLSESRSCGDCTACCDGWLQIEVYGHHIRRGKPCPFSIENKCSIYNERPQEPCREFRCGWLVKSSPLPEWMRPDKADMILLAANFSWRGLPVDVAVAVRDRPKQKALDWLTKFSSEKKRLLIYQLDGDWFAFGPPGIPGRNRRANRAGREALGKLITQWSRGTYHGSVAANFGAASQLKIV
jgi:hypothetical protein